MPAGIFSDDIGQVVAQAHGQTFAALAVLADGSTVALDVEGGSVSWDEARAPRVRATLVCRVPDVGTLASLDPRLAVRVQLTAGYVRPGGATETALIADLGLRKRPVRRPDNTMTLECASDEALALDNAPVFGGATGAVASVPLAMQALLNAALDPDPTLTITHTDATATSEVDIQDRWQTVDDLADRIDADVYDDGTRQWWITPRPTIAGTPVATLEVGAAGTILRSESTIDRDEWANVVKLRYRWTDSSNVQHTVVGTATATGTFAPSASVPTRIFRDDRETPATSTQANNAAAAVLKRFIARSRSYTLTAVAMWWVRPGDTVTVQLPTGGPETHLVASVDFDPSDATMTVTTRLPDGLNINGE